MECGGTEIKYAERFNSLIYHLSQPTCVLTDLNLAGTVGHLVGKALEEIITEAVAAQLKTTLQCMDLSSNGLSGEIPPAIGYLKRLNKLMLNRNQLEGGVEAVGELHNLEWVSLGKNKLLRGSIASLVDGCPKLRMLGLEQNAFDGEIPTTIGSCTQLQALIVDGNNLTGHLPAEIAQCSELRLLSMGGNMLSGTLASLGGCWSKLEAISMEDNTREGYDCGLEGPIPPSLFANGTLAFLNLENNKLEGPIPIEIGQATTLQKVWLGGNRLDGEIPHTLAECSFLVAFGAEDNNLHGDFTVEFVDILHQKCPLLRELVLEVGGDGNRELDIEVGVWDRLEDTNFDGWRL
jgi:hypothetical protein